MFDDKEETPVTLATKEEEILEYYDDEEEEEYQEFTDFGILEENSRKKRIMNLLFGIVMILIILTVIDIIAVTKYQKGPFFAIPTTTYKDGGTKEYYGLGYKVIKYHQIQGRRDLELGFWSLNYNTSATTVKESDLALDFILNKERSIYYKKFIRVASTLKEVDILKHQITLEYLDTNSNYSLDIICEMVEEQKNLDTFQVQKEITIIGTTKKYKQGNEKENHKLIISNCFAEQ